MEKKYLKEIPNVLLAIGAVYVLTVFSMRNDYLEKLFNTSQPIATLFIGMILSIIAISTYRKTINHKLFVSFEAKEEILLNEYGCIFDEGGNFNYKKLDKNIVSNYITQMYAHNEKNKVEIINKVFLQLKSEEIILILDFGNKPLLIPPYASKDSARSDAIELQQMVHFLVPTDFYQEENQENFNPRAYAFRGSNIFSNKKNKIIVESGDERFYITPNSQAKDQFSKKTKKNNERILVKSSLRNNKPVTFNHQYFLFFKYSNEKFSDNLNNFPNVVPGTRAVTSDENFFLREIKNGLVKISQKKIHSFSQDNFIKGFGFCIFADSGNFKNSYVSSFYDSGEKKHHLPVGQEGQNILSNFPGKYLYHRDHLAISYNFKNFIDSIFGLYFKNDEKTDFFVFKNKPKIIE